jgi:excisionase family DNA binding protein
MARVSLEAQAEALKARAKELLNAREAAEYLHVSENTIRQWIWQRRLPVVKLGRAVRLKKSDLDQIINSNRREAMTHI